MRRIGLAMGTETERGKPRIHRRPDTIVLVHEATQQSGCVGLVYFGQWSVCEGKEEYTGSLGAQQNYVVII